MYVFFYLTLTFCGVMGGMGSCAWLAFSWSHGVSQVLLYVSMRTTFALVYSLTGDYNYSLKKSHAFLRYLVPFFYFLLY